MCLQGLEWLSWCDCPQCDRSRGLFHLLQRIMDNLGLNLGHESRSELLIWTRSSFLLTHAVFFTFFTYRRNLLLWAVAKTLLQQVQISHRRGITFFRAAGVMDRGSNYHNEKLLEEHGSFIVNPLIEWYEVLGERHHRGASFFFISNHAGRASKTPLSTCKD